MSKKANPSVIGVFIVTGVVLLVIGLMVFSSGNLFSKKQKFILYFEGSMKGMSVGAPVQYRGVTIGKVVEIYVAHHQAPDDLSMPLVVELDESLLREKTDRRIVSLRDKAKDMVAKGLRGRMDAASLVTGVLQVQLDLIPDAPPPVYHQIGDAYAEIPTAPTTIEMLLANLARIDIQGMADKLGTTLARLDSKLSALNVQEINAGVTNLLASINRTVSSPDLTNSFASLHRTLDDFGVLARRIDNRIDPLAGDITNTLARANGALVDIRAALQGLSTIVAPDAPLQTDLTGALNQLSDAARSISELAEFLKRNPDALITGRTPPKEKP